MTEKKKPLVLLIDDDIDFGELYRILLSPDFDLLVARGGEEGIRLIAARQPEAVLLDMRMPRVSGFDVLNYMRTWPVTRRIPVIVITACHLKGRIGSRLDTECNICAALEKTVSPARVTRETRRALLLAELYKATPGLRHSIDAAEAVRRG